MTRKQRAALVAKQFVRTPNGFLSRHPQYGSVTHPDASYAGFTAYTSSDPRGSTAIRNAKGEPKMLRTFEAAVEALVP